MVNPRLKNRLIRAAITSFLGMFCFISAAWPQEQVPLSMPDHSSALTIEPGFFDPDGSYYPVPALIVSDYIVEIRIETLEYYYDNDIHYDKPRFQPPKVRMELTHVPDQSQTHYDCPRPIVGKDQLYFVCKNSPIGVLSFNGVFLDKRGQFWKRKDIVALETIILTGEVIIRQDGIDSKPQRVSFSYWHGN